MKLLKIKDSWKVPSMLKRKKQQLMRLKNDK